MIKNEALKRYIMYQLDKVNDYFSEYDLEKIEEVLLDYNDTEDFDFNELLELNNLSDLTLCNYNISNDNLYKILMITELKHLTLDHCVLNESCIVLASLSLEKLSLINSSIPNYDFVYLIDSLRSLHITNGILDIVKLNRLKNLEILDISNSNVSNLDKEFTLNIKELYIENSNITDLNILKNLTNLNTLSIDDNQLENNKEIIDELMNNKVIVLKDGLTIMNEGEVDGEI